MIKFLKRVKVLFILTISIFIVLVVLSVGGYHYWSTPEFCKSCHIMVPYYNAWRASTHNGVACVKCHFEPGIENELKGKWIAIKQLAAFLTGAYSSKPYAEISDRSCLRSGCHSQRLISGKVLYTKRKIQFDHTPHLTELRKGIKLSCTSCHSQIVIGTHISVTNSTCFLCHFQNNDKRKLGGNSDEKSQNCLLCHNAPENSIIKDGFLINHSDFVSRGIVCTSCHIDVTVGSGAVSKDRCFHCHNDIDKVEKFDKTELIHINHIAVRKVECDRCHEPIEHKFNTTLVHEQNKECNSCHKNFHIIQQKFYMGQGAKDLTGKPDPMFRVGIGCSACHIVPKSALQINDGVNETLVSNKYTCFACHGKKYKNFPVDFINSISKYILSIQRVLEILDTASFSDNTILSSLKFNIDFLKAVKAIHNPFYAIDIIQKCFNDIENIVRNIRISGNEINEFIQVKEQFSKGLCNICHNSMPARGVLELNSKKFPHDKHIRELEISCIECHKVDGAKTFSSQHPPKANLNNICNSCHE